MANHHYNTFTSDKNDYLQFTFNISLRSSEIPVSDFRSSISLNAIRCGIFPLELIYSYLKIDAFALLWQSINWYQLWRSTITVVQHRKIRISNQVLPFVHFSLNSVILHPYNHIWCVCIIMAKHQCTILICELLVEQTSVTLNLHILGHR